ncbi:DUF1016 family protein [Ectothiorhodospiraceae bacterium BW-2]|nr:DUF1016 family protein [Ectothiorhodospiraceae bacterium BW-2]
MATNKRKLGKTTEHTENTEHTEVSFGGLVGDIREIISQARSLTRRSVNSLQVISNYLIGMRIVFEEQSGQERADYGKATLKELSAELTEEFGRGYSRSNLEYMRKFYLTYAPSIEKKSQTLSGISGYRQISQAVSNQSLSHKPQTLSEEFDIAKITQTLSAQLPSEAVKQFETSC